MNTSMRKKDRKILAPYSIARTRREVNGRGVLSAAHKSSVSAHQGHSSKNVPSTTLPQSPPPAQQPRILHLTHWTTTPTPPTTSNLLPSASQRLRDPPIHALLYLPQVFVQHSQCNDHEEAKYEGGGRRDVPLREDNACVDDLGVPGEREE